MNQTDKGNSITKGELEAIRDKYRQRRYDECIREVKNRHRSVYLISGSHQILVDQIAMYLNIFFESFGTRDDFNMVGSNKVKFIKENLKIHDFDYFGNSHKDLPIWEYTKRAIHTNASQKLIKTIKSKNLENREIPANFNITK